MRPAAANAMPEGPATGRTLTTASHRMFPEAA